MTLKKLNPITIKGRSGIEMQFYFKEDVDKLAVELEKRTKSRKEDLPEGEDNIFPLLTEFSKGKIEAYEEVLESLR